jgi:hypothetical protein
MADSYNIAGKGSYGIVIGPALPNINNEGKRINFPQNVSKIYVNRGSYRNALNTSRKIRNTIPSLNIKTTPYKWRYTIKTLPNSIKHNVKNFLKNHNDEINNNDELPILRMPNLGYDAADINHNPQLYRVLRQIPFRKICYEMYKCMNIVKAIYDAGYIHGDIRETNVLFNLNNSIMTIIDFDWLRPFNEIYNTYPEFFYPWPPECLFIFERKTKHKENIGMNSLFRNDMTVRSNDTILKYYESVMNRYDFYIPYEATKGMRHFLNNIKPFRSNARNVDERYEDIHNYYNELRLELFNITKPYIDSYGLGFTFFKLLQRAWAINISMHGFQTNSNDNIILLTDISSDLRNNKYSMGGVNKDDDKEIEAFSNMRKFIFEELIPGMVHSNYTKRWTIDEAINKFREKMEEIDIDLFSDDKKLVSDELQRLELLALIRNDKYKGVNNDEIIISKIKPKYYNKSNPFAILANNNNNNNNNNKRNGGKRKTRKNKRN